MSALQDKLRQYYLDHEADLAEKYGGKFVVLVDGGVFGVYATEAEAHQAATGKLDPGLFLIQEVPRSRPADRLLVTDSQELGVTQTEH